MKTIVLGLMLAAGPGQAATSCLDNKEAVRSAAAPVVACFRREAKRLEPSKEPARDIAVAVAGRCQTFMVSFKTTLTECADRDLTSMDSIAAMASRLSEIARNAAISEVVEIRAAQPATP